MPSKKDVELVLNLQEDEFFEYYANEEVSEPGLRHVNLMLLYLANMRDLPGDFDRTFQTKQGRFSKRVSAYFHKNHNIKLDEKTLSEVGNLANRYTVRHSIVYEFTRDFNWCAGQFGDDSSCFWGGNSSAKGMILANGGYAIRLFNFSKVEDPTKVDVLRYGVGRAWILPAYFKEGTYPVVFNAYRKNGYSFETRDFAEILAKHLSDKTGEKLVIKRIRLSNNDETGGLLYLNRNVYENGMRQDNPKIANNSGGYLVAPEEICKETEHYDFNLANQSGYGYGFEDEEEYNDDMFCPHCEEYRNEDDFTWVEHYHGENRGDDVCNYCIDSGDFVNCARCRQHPYMRSEYSHEVLTIEGHYSQWCPRCFENHAAVCDNCSESFSIATRERDGLHLEYLHDENTGEYFCPSCSQNNFECEHCHSVFADEEKHEIDEKIVCEGCYAELYDAEISNVKFPSYTPLNMAIFKNPLEDADEEPYTLEEIYPESLITPEEIIRMADQLREFYQQFGVPANSFHTNSRTLSQQLTPIARAWGVREENEDE